MSEWNGNNRACETTWTTLRVLDQNLRPFKDSGTIKMAELKFWTQGASSEMHKIQADTLGNQIDNVFRDIRGAVYEPGVTRETAISGLVGILTDQDKTIADLASKADDLYRFWQES
jgi:hypothetical protein